MPAAAFRFGEKLLEAARKNNSWLCVGLDPDPMLLPEPFRGQEAEQWLVSLCRGAIEATEDLVCCYKPNLAFFEAFGEMGIRALATVVASVPKNIPTIGDAKRGDIANSARRYAEALYQGLGFDAVTVHAYLGSDSLAPFFAYPDRGVFVLCKTSNPSAADIEDLPVLCPDGSTEPLFLQVARAALSWDQHGTVGLVAGATRAADAARIRAVAPDVPFLVPGVGAQAGDLEAAVHASVDRNGERAIVSASRSVVSAGRDAHWRDAARAAALSLRDQINVARGARPD